MKVDKKSMKPWGRVFLLLGLGLMLSACDRETSSSSRVSLELPAYNQSSPVQQSLKDGVIASDAGTIEAFCNPCLKSIAISIEGSEFKTINYSQQHSDFDLNGSSLTTSVSFEVPGGNARKIQVLALYRKNSDDQNEAEFNMHFGRVSVDLNTPEPPPILLRLSKLDQFKQGSIQGRFLNAANSGPSTRVNIEYHHPESGLKLEMGSGEMVNGWFSLMASENFALTYWSPAAKMPYFSNVTTETFKAQASSQIAHVYRPPNHYRKVLMPDTSTETRLVKEGRNLVFGFFGPFADASHVVCKQYVAGSVAIDNLLTGSDPVSSPNLEFSATANPNKVYVTGGELSGSCVDNEKLFTPNQISIRVGQFDGKGEDIARGISGAFTAVKNVEEVFKFYRTGTSVVLKTIPELFGYGTTVSFDGIKLYKKNKGATVGDIRNRITCSEKGMSSLGYTEVTDFDSPPEMFAGTENNITFMLMSTPLSSEVFAACPKKEDKLTGYGGIYLGALAD